LQILWFYKSKLVLHLYVVYLRPNSGSQGYIESTEWAIMKAMNWEGRGKKLLWPKQLGTVVFPAGSAKHYDRPQHDVSASRHKHRFNNLPVWCYIVMSCATSRTLTALVTI